MKIRGVKESTFSKVKTLLVNPNQFFRTLVSQKEIKPALFFSIRLSALAAILHLIFFDPNISELFFDMFIFPLTLTFIFGLLLNLALNFTGFKSTYRGAYNISVYTMISYFLLGWIALSSDLGSTLVFLATIAGQLYLLTVAIQSVYKVERKPALIAVGMEIILFLVFVLLTRFILA